MTIAEHQAEGILRDFDLSFPINPKAVCEAISSSSFNIEYHEAQLPEHICGLSMGNKNSIQIIVNSQIAYQERRLFTGGHEIGHAVLHIGTGKQSHFECSKNELRENGNSEKKLEMEANQFASALLMPRSLIQKIIIRADLTWDLIQEISTECGTSLEATARRIISITKEPYALIIHENQKMWSPVKSKSFPAFISNLVYPKNLLTLPDNIREHSRGKLEECDPSDWGLESKRKERTCYYSSMYFAKNNRIMTLLLLEEVDEEEEEDVAEWEAPHF